MQYQSGVYHASENCGYALNHGVLLTALKVSTAADEGYFMIKNSWGPNWGLNGYIKVAISEGKGTCGIANQAAVAPILA